MNLSKWLKHLSFWHNKSDDECIEMATNEYGVNVKEALKNMWERDFCKSINNSVTEELLKTKMSKEGGSKYPELPRTVSRMLSRVGYDKLLDSVNKTILEKEFSSTQEYWKLFREELLNQNNDE